jgi:hypothetical protein
MVNISVVLTEYIQYDNYSISASHFFYYAMILDGSAEPKCLLQHGIIEQ